MTLHAEGGRPGRSPETASTNNDLTSPQATEAPRTPHLSAAEIAASKPTYVLIVRTPTDRITRRVFLSLHAAVKASQRAEARGHAISLELCRLVPYMTGAELHAGVNPDA